MIARRHLTGLITKNNEIKNICMYKYINELNNVKFSLNRRNGIKVNFDSWRIGTRRNGNIPNDQSTLAIKTSNLPRPHRKKYVLAHDKSLFLSDILFKYLYINQNNKKIF